MQSKLDPYLNFKDNTREAMTFYQAVFGGELAMRTFKDFNASHDPKEDNLIMHSELRAPNGMTLMASDIPVQLHPDYHAGSGFSLALSGDNEPELSGYFQKLSEGGQVTQPLTKSPWGDTFGMVTDRFGTTWLVNISAGRE